MCMEGGMQVLMLFENFGSLNFILELCILFLQAWIWYHLATLMRDLSSRRVKIKLHHTHVARN